MGGLACPGPRFGLQAQRHHLDAQRSASACAQHRQRHNHSTSFNVTTRRLAEFLQSVEAEESLPAQRIRDGESRNTRMGIVTGAENSDAIVGQKVPARPEHIASALDETTGEMYG